MSRSGLAGLGRETHNLPEVLRVHMGSSLNTGKLSNLEVGGSNPPCGTTIITHRADACMFTQLDTDCVYLCLLPSPEFSETGSELRFFMSTTS